MIVPIYQIPELVRPLLESAPQEQFVVVSLDTKLKPIGVHPITIGTLDSSLVHPREVFRVAMLANARAIFVVHNHPSGDLIPSKQDIKVTERLKKCGKMLGIAVLDHIIVGVDDSGEYRGISLAEAI
jgi:DNA repair proteins